MANTVITGTSFVGTASTDLVSSALLDATSIAKGYLTPITKIKKSHKLRIADLSNAIQADGCSFNDQGTVTITERYLTPAHLKVNHQECKTTLEAEWASLEMQAGQLNSTIPASYKAWLQMRLTGQVAEGMEQLIWQGKISGSTGIYLTKPFLTSIDGIYTKAKADSNTIKVSGTTVTTSNVLAEVEKVFAAIPENIYDKANIKIFVPRQILRAYQSALPTTYSANGNFDITKEQSTFYKGIELVPVGLANNTMIAAQTSNLFFGTDLTSDMNEVRIIDMSETDASDYIRFKMRFEADVNYAISTEVVVYN